MVLISLLMPQRGYDLQPRVAALWRLPWGDGKQLLNRNAVAPALRLLECQ